MTSGQKMENVILENVLPTKYFLPLSLPSPPAHTALLRPPRPRNTHTQNMSTKNSILNPP